MDLPSVGFLLSTNVDSDNVQTRQTFSGNIVIHLLDITSRVLLGQFERSGGPHNSITVLPRNLNI